MNSPRAIDELAYFLDRMTDARCEVAIAKLAAFERLAFDLPAELPDQWHERAIDALQEIAEANGLVRIHGQDLIQEILATGFDDAG